MASRTDHQKEFISLFKQTARYHTRYQVFRDFCNCAMAAIHNKHCFSEELEQLLIGLYSCFPMWCSDWRKSPVTFSAVSLCSWNWAIKPLTSFLPPGVWPE